MSVRAKTGRRRRVYRHVSLLLLITFGIQSGAVAQAPPPALPPTPAYRVSNPLPGLRPVLQYAGADGHEAPDDPTAPTLTVSAVRTLLWPPNHEMWDVGLVVTATDELGSTLSASRVNQDAFDAALGKMRRTPAVPLSHISPAIVLDFVRFAYIHVAQS